MSADRQPSGPIAIPGHPVEIAGRYRVRRRLGEGGMGVVYECEHVLSKKRLAVKVLFPHLCHGAQAVERFRREVSAAAEIDHPGIVQVFDAGVDTDGSFYMAMELLEGESVAERLRSRWPSMHEAVDLVRQVLAPLGRAHERGFVHRDIKPENLFFARDAATGREAVKLLDFGLAREVQRKGPTLTGITFGTPEYMSPEQSMSAKKAGLPSDVWAVGVLLYELLSGFHPFDGETPNAIMVAAIKEPFVPLRERAPHVPPAVAKVVEACLVKEPEKRPADARVVAGLLEKALADVTLADTRPVRTHLDVAREREEAEAREAGDGPTANVAALPRAEPGPARLGRGGQRGVSTHPLAPGVSEGAVSDRTLRRVALTTAAVAGLALLVGLALALRHAFEPAGIDATPLAVEATAGGPIAAEPAGLAPGSLAPTSAGAAPPGAPALDEGGAVRASALGEGSGAPEAALGEGGGMPEAALLAGSAVTEAVLGEGGAAPEVGRAEALGPPEPGGRPAPRRAGETAASAAAPVAAAELTDAEYAEAQACVARGEASCAIAILRRSPRSRDLARVVDLYESTGRTTEALSAMQSFVRRFPRASESARFRETLERHGR